MEATLPYRPVRIELGVIFFLFFISGFSALCYQIVWQRMLFATFGINTESVTIIVSIFMLGLGIGGIVGGNFQHRPHRMLALFIIFESAIGFFGLCSPTLIRLLGETINSASLWAIGLGAYALFAIPTFLMGATLPILVSYVQSRVSLTSLALGWLYASNAFGAMAASGLTVTVLFVYFGQNEVLNIAVALNLMTAFSALLFFWKHRTAPQPTAHAATQSSPTPEDRTGNLSARVLLCISFALGYITLSQELYWYRVLSFVTANTPETFGLLLAAFLLGIALATISVCRAIKQRLDLSHYIVSTLALSALLWFLAVPTMGAVATMGSRLLVFCVGLVFVTAISYFTGGVFTALCHLLQQRLDVSASKTVGILYFSNVLGAALGPLLTGFLLFEHLSLRSLTLLIGMMLLLTSIAFATRLSASLALGSRSLLMIGSALTVGIILHFTAYTHIMEKLQMSAERFTVLKSNRSGFISAIGKKIYGNGIYDNTMNFNPESAHDVNKIFRVYAVPTFHPNPIRILIIGTNSGSWAKVVSMYEPLQKLTTLEINKGYLDIIGHYPDYVDILSHPKIEIVINDGRRWLKNNPDEKFDVIISNAIYHWRSNATNLLSREFMELCRSRLKRGGKLYINDTGSEDVAFTAAHVFKYVTRTFNIMVIAGDTPSEVPPDQKRANLAQFRYPDGKPVYSKQEAIEALVNITYPNQRDTWLARQDLLLITDDNMATEFKKNLR